MVSIMIDMTKRPHKRYVTGTALCKYCRHDLFPHGKIVDLQQDKLARYTSKGDWKCGVCVTEDAKKATALFNRKTIE